jgi:hypothetical protein
VLHTPAHTRLRLRLQGKKLVFYDLAIVCKWEGELVDGEGSLLGTGDGELSIPELDQDAGPDDYRIEVRLAVRSRGDTAGCAAGTNAFGSRQRRASLISRAPLETMRRSC